MEELKKYPGQVIWKSTTSIHKQEGKIMGAFRRYLTNQVILLVPTNKRRSFQRQNVVWTLLQLSISAGKINFAFPVQDPIIQTNFFG